jgi:tetratricopeptide (TPR) repeat protein
METNVWIEKYMTDAEHLIMDGNVNEGLEILKNLLYEEPGYASLHNHLGWAYLYHVRNESQAELHLKMAMRFHVEFAPPYLHLGNLYARQARYTEAIEVFREGLTKPNAIKGALLEGIAQAHEMQGYYALAVRAYKDAATASVIDYEVDRMLNSVKRCRRKRLALLFSFW